jgi:hypothetical protein
MHFPMKQRRRILVLWSVLGLLAATLLYAVYEPLWVAWRCYRLHEDGEHVAAEVVGKDPQLGLILQVTEGSQAGNACTADASAAQYEGVEPGDRLAVVVRPEVPGECTLESTLTASLVVLWVVSAGVGFALLLLASVGVWIHRGLVAAPRLTSHLGLESKDVKCPSCGEEMAEGYLPILSGIHWRRLEQPIGLPHALSGMPGTVGWKGRPCLHAFRCETCRIVTFGYGSLGASPRRI